jgi:hypothetical protein
MAYPLPEPVQFADMMFRKVQEGKANGIRKRGANAHATNLLTTVGRYYPENTPAERKLVGTLKDVQWGTQPSGDRGSKRAWKAMKGTVSTEPHRSTELLMRADHAQKEFLVETQIENTRNIRAIRSHLDRSSSSLEKTVCDGALQLTV